MAQFLKTNRQFDFGNVQFDFLMEMVARHCYTDRQTDELVVSVAAIRPSLDIVLGRMRRERYKAARKLKLRILKQMQMQDQFKSLNQSGVSNGNENAVAAATA